MSNSQNRPWWSSDKDKVAARVKSVSRINDPGTVADEILKAAKIIAFILLIYSGFLGFLSYQTSFTTAFGPFAAVIMALALTAVVEWGKQKAMLWALRIPFFQGFGHIFSSPANTFLWIGLVAVGIGTYLFSAYNSTIGADRLAGMMHRNATEVKFSANTAEIDAQIARSEQRIADHSKNKWKGVVAYESQKAIKAETQNLNKLSDQRQQAINQQRSDYEAQAAVKTEEGSWVAGMASKSGGGVEVIYVFLSLVWASCEKVLASRADRRQADDSENINVGIGFNRRQANPIQNQAPAAPPEAPENPRRIGFGPRDDSGNFVPFGNTVSQHQAPVSQGNDAALYKTIGGDLISPDELLKHFETQLRREPSNFRRKDAIPETVAKRVVTVLENAQSAINNAKAEDFSPEQAAKFADFVNQICLLMRHYGFEHDYSGMIAVLFSKTKRYATA